MSSINTNINPLTNKAYSENYHVLRNLAQNLPVSQQIPQLLSAIRQNNVVIVVGETGSGKTTQLPKAIVLNDLMKSGQKLAVTQNRRLAAQLVAERIAEELDVHVGGVVGLKHRGSDLTNEATRLEVITDGSLVAAAKKDPGLQNYGAIVVDEAHQHTVATDLLLGLLKELAERRKDDLKIIIMSATINADLFLNFFPGSVLETVSGRQHKVTVSYLEAPPDENTIVNTILQVHLVGRSGNILVFVDGVGEMSRIIKEVEEALYGEKARFSSSDIGRLECWPLYATLSLDAQNDAVESVAPAPQSGNSGRKLLVATNIAETSITLTGVTHVIDSCKFKSKIWNPREESWSLKEQWVSKAVAQQRAGRAGRTREGRAYRMCTEKGFHEQLLEQPVPAMVEGDMLMECLSILKIGKSPLTFPYIVAPAAETIAKALGILYQLGAVDQRGERLTARGEEIARLPVDVYSAIVLLESPQYDCSDEMLSLISMIEASDGGRDVFIKPVNKEEKKRLRQIRAEFCHGSGDHLTLFNIYMSWRAAGQNDTAAEFVKENMLNGSTLKLADQTRLQLLKMLVGHGSWKLCYLDPSKPGYYTQMLKALATGNYLRVAKYRMGRGYETVRHGAPVKLTAETDISGQKEWVIYHEYHNNGHEKTIRLVSAIAPEILISAQPNYWCDAEFVPKGHIQDGLVHVIAKMTGQPEDFIRGGMPNKPASSQ